jgi:GntR family transcriptional regulator, arabinose operon transcriptional repressor
MAKINTILANLRNDVENETYTDRLPSLRALSEQYEVNLKTMNKAISLLVADGVLKTERGRGTFVNNANETKEQRPEDKVVALLVRARGDMFENIYNKLVKDLQDKGFFPLLIPHEQEGGSRERLDDILKLNPRALMIDSGIYSVDYEYLKTIAKQFRKIIFLVQHKDEYEFTNAIYVLSDYFYGAYIAIKHLAELGHRKILLLRHKNASQNALLHRHERVYEFTNGYTLAMNEFGLANDISIIDIPAGKPEANDIQNWHADFKNLFGTEDHPTAIISFLDYWLIECMEMLKQFKLNVPEDVSMVGCHNTQWTSKSKVKLTSISLRESEIARIAIEKVISTQNGFGITTVKPKLIVRDSTMFKK